MKNIYFSQRVVVLCAFVISLLGGCGKAPNGNSAGTQGLGPISADVEPGDEPVFVDATEEGILMEGERGADEGVDEILSIRRRYVRVNFSSLVRRARTANIGDTVAVTGELPLNLFDNDSLVISLGSIERLSMSEFVINGKIKDDPDSAATLVVNKDVLVANVRRGESAETFEVRHTRNGLHSVEIRQDAEEDECPAIDAASAGDSVAMDETTADSGGTDSIMASPVIDILAAYTPNARVQQGGTAGIRALIHLGIADTNAALMESGSLLRVRLVGMMEVARNESGDWSLDLRRLRTKGDGKWDEVHAMRTRLGADQVSLVATYPRSSSVMGIGYIRAGVSTAFTIVKSRAFGQYTFSHELGHNLGLNHSDGYLNRSGRFRTIIAYGTLPRIRRYSNPSELYAGFRTGDGSHNEVRIINNNSLRTSSLVPKRID